ncbi:MAG TPA: F-BAR domain-containing protein [Humibacter sp.]|nr:F-BAR domain-containing protein [Humibacter sp.]
MNGQGLDGDAGELGALQARLQAVANIDRGIADALHLIPDDVTAFWRSRAQVEFARRLADLADRLVLARTVLDDAQSTMQRGVDALAAGSHG